MKAQLSLMLIQFISMTMKNYRGDNYSAYVHKFNSVNLAKIK